MGLVSEAVLELVRSQVERHGVVVWYDPDKIYEGLLDSLEIDGGGLHKWSGSYFRLRHEFDGALGNAQAPKLLIYVPDTRENSNNALLEAEAAGAVLQPGHQSPTRNTRLAVVARSALAQRMTADNVEGIVRQVEDGTLGLADLDELADSSVSDSAVLRVLFGTTDPVQMIVKLVGDPRIDQAITAKGALGDVKNATVSAVGMAEPKASTVAEFRERLVQHLFTAELAMFLGREVADGLGLPRPPEPKVARSTIESVVATWRSRRDLQGSYVVASKTLDERLDLDFMALDAAVLSGVTSFARAEEALQRKVEEAALETPTRELLDLANSRLDSFWSAANPVLLERWALIAAALQVLVTSETIGEGLKNAEAAARDLAQAYLHDEPNAPAWCELDSSFRSMERRYRRSESYDLPHQDRLERLIALARSAYSVVTHSVALSFSSALADTGTSIPGVEKQRQVFQNHVEPALEVGKTAYILVDGMRYEMARELASAFGGDYEVELVPCQAQLPTVTHVGMAALLPYAHQGLELTAREGPGLSVRVSAVDVTSRSARLAYLEKNVGHKTIDLKLEQLLPPSAKVRKKIAEAGLIVVTATDELDGLCEASNIAMAHRLMDDVLVQLRRAVRALLENGVHQAIITSDHGFLMGVEIGAGDKINPPGGETAELHRRVWIGHGGAEDLAYYRLSAKDVGLDGDIDIAIPRGIGCFKVRGGQTAYFHGGASPQELFIPVMRVQKVGAVPEVSGQIKWSLSLGSQVISSPFVSIHIEGEGDGLYDISPPRVRVQVKEGRNIISQPVSAAYGYDDGTGDVALELAGDSRVLRKNTIVVRLDPMPSVDHLAIHLIDAETDLTLASLAKVPVALAGF